MYKINHIGRLKKINEIFNGSSQAELEQKYHDLVNSTLAHTSEDTIAAVRNLIIQKDKMLLDSDI